MASEVEEAVEEAGTPWTVATDPDGTLSCVCARRVDPRGPVEPGGS